MADGKAVVEDDACVDCGVCVDACPVEAISL
jgi:NAD-dependent dihydropyrimidine dehydrogenase PreA subunit